MHSKELKRKCPLCEATCGNVILNLRYAMFDGCPLDPEFGMVACNQCGFVFFDTSTLHSDLHQYYKNCLFYHTSEQQAELDQIKIQTPALKRLFHTAERVAEYIPDRAARVVDIGANNGAQLLVLRQFGFINLCGVDMRQSSVDTMRALGLEAHLGSAEELPQKTQKADVCLMSHTLEHLLDPVGVISNVRHSLTDNGILYVEVPDAENYPIQDLSQWYKFMFHEHINHFDLHHLEALAVANGLEVIEMGHKMIAHRGTRLNDENKVPCIFGLFRKTKANGSHVASCFNLKRKLHSSIKAFTFDPGDCLKKMVRSRCRIFLWGISQYAQLMLGSTPLRNYSHLQLIDRDPFKQTQLLNCKAILPPSRLKNISADSVVLFSDKQAASTMEDYLVKNGFEGKTHILGFTDAIL